MRVISEGLQRAPNALYPLVQTALVQDEALKRADARIRELESQLGIAAAEQPRQGGFLDSMRDALTGRSQGSVPSVRPGAPSDRERMQQIEVAAGARFALAVEVQVSG